jgi:hypothetical protein
LHSDFATRFNTFPHSSAELLSLSSSLLLSTGITGADSRTTGAHRREAGCAVCVGRAVDARPLATVDFSGWSSLSETFLRIGSAHVSSGAGGSDLIAKNDVVLFSTGLAAFQPFSDDFCAAVVTFTTLAWIASLPCKWTMRGETLSAIQPK